MEIHNQVYLEQIVVLPVTVSIPSAATTENLTFSAGSITLVAGANGVGKSALLYDLYRRLSAETASYYPGHRQISFNNGWDNIQQDMSQLLQNLYNHHSAFNRYKSSWSEDHFKMIVRKLQNAETKYRGELFERFRTGDPNAMEEARSDGSPISRLNTVFNTAGLTVNLSIDESGLLVTRSGATYRIDQMSDGERAALFLVGAIITQPPNTVILIDEPERHLHPSISGPLLEVAARIRSDLAYVFSTHDLSILEHLIGARIIHILDSTVISQNPESREYTSVTIDEGSQVPEDIRIDLLGARKNILFVEGENSSLDRQLYAHLYEDWKVVPKGGWEKCVGAVKHLAENAGIHWVRAAAIVDGDGRTSEEVAAWVKEDIHTLPCPTIENLFLLEAVLLSVARVVSNLKGGADPTARIAKLQKELPAILAKYIDAMVDRRTVWRVNRMLESSKISVAEVRMGTAEILPINIKENRDQTLAEVLSIIEKHSPMSALARLPVKNTGIPAAVSEIIGAGKFEDLQRIVLRQIELDSSEGRAIVAAIETLVPKLQTPH